MKKIRILVCLLLVLCFGCASASAISLKKGSAGLEPYYLALRLNHLGYDAGAQPDGKYGNELAEAVKSFQKANGLKATGTVNNETWNAVFRESYTLSQFVKTAQFSNRTYRISGLLVPPFTEAKRVENPNGPEYHAQLLADGVDCNIYLEVRNESADEYDKLLKSQVKESFAAQIEKQYAGKKYKVSEEKKFKLNGKDARSFKVTWEHTADGMQLTHIACFGFVELDEVYGQKLKATAVLACNVPANTVKAFSSCFNSNTIKEILSGIRCGKDRLADYQAGAAKRQKAAKLKKKIKLPDFQPVEETEQDLLEMIYDMTGCMNPLADGASGEFDPQTCVSMYYGTKIMQRYLRAVDAGNKPSDARSLMILSVGNGVFDDKFKENIVEIRDTVRTALAAARLALKPEAKPYLVLLGVDEPRWTREDLDAVYEALVSTLDRMAERYTE